MGSRGGVTTLQWGRPERSDSGVRGTKLGVLDRGSSTKDFVGSGTPKIGGPNARPT